MRISTRHVTTMMLAAAAFATAVPVQAQLIRPNVPGSVRSGLAPAINQGLRVGAAMNLQQYAVNSAILGRVAAIDTAAALTSPLYASPLSVVPNYPVLTSGYNSAAPAYLSVPSYGTPGATLTTTGGDPYASLAPTAGLPVPYNPYNPYNSAYADPYGGYLRGVADLVNSQGQYMMQEQQARITQNQADSGRLDLRRKAWEQAAWEQKMTPSVEQMRQYEMKQQLSRAISNPPANEVWDGTALNNIFDSLRDRQAAGAKGPNVPLDPETLKKINVLVSGGNGNVGLLKNSGDLSWPFSLTSDEFKEGREKLSKLIPEAVQQVRFNNKVGIATLRDIIAAQKSLRETLERKNTSDLTPSETLEARRYLNQIDDAIKALQDPNVGNYFNTWIVKGNNVADVVDYMAKTGIKFAPATQGTQDAYRALHTRMVAYYRGLSDTANASTAPK